MGDPLAYERLIEGRASAWHPSWPLSAGWRNGILQRLGQYWGSERRLAPCDQRPQGILIGRRQLDSNGDREARMSQRR